MQLLSEANCNIILNNNFVGVEAPLLYVDIGGKTNIKVLTFGLSREFGALAQGCTIRIPNVDPVNPIDTGYYNQQRDATDYNKPANEFADIIQPGALVTVKTGYGDSNTVDTVQVFIGTIDTVKAKFGSNGEATITILCRGKSKKTVESTIFRTITTTGAIGYWINYPITSTVTEFYLKYADTNPYLYEIWVDACMRSGYAEVDLDWDTTWTTRQSNCDGDAFKMCTGTWMDLAQKVADILGAYMYEDEDGKMNLKVANNQVNAGNDTLTLNGTTYTALEDGGYARAIYESIEVTNWMSTEYTRADWDFDYASNSIRRSAGSSIGDGEEIIVTYTYCAWVFRPKTLFGIEQIVSHDDMYGRIVATNEELKLVSSTTLDALGDGSALSTNKTLIEDVPEYVNQTQLDAYTAAKRLEMRKHYFNVSLDCVAVPHLRVRDIICPLLWGTVTGLYEITGFSLDFDAETGLEMTIEAVYYGSSGVY